MTISRNGLSALRDGALHTGTVGQISRDGRSIHAAYRYPARFSPVFARAAIELFSSEGELVIDPFCGGGTTSLEASRCGRHSFSSDLSPLATFLTSAKGRIYRDEEYEAVTRWSERCVRTKHKDLMLALREYPIPEEHIGGLRRPDYRFIRAALSSWKRSEEELAFGSDLARLCLLRVGQRMLDLRREPPSLDEFRRGLEEAVAQTIDASRLHRETVNRKWQGKRNSQRFMTEQIAIEELYEVRRLQDRQATLAVCSPPYPGVHTLYPRWQIEGRRETTIPFWLAGVTGDTGEKTYTMGGRGTACIDEFIDLYTSGMKSLSKVLQPEGHVVQMVGFSEPRTQLPRLLKAMREAGFHEQKFRTLQTQEGRLWRKVSRQKWYSAVRSQETSGASEVVLIHRLEGP